jgi:hypothetical protein
MASSYIAEVYHHGRLIGQIAPANIGHGGFYFVPRDSFVADEAGHVDMTLRLRWQNDAQADYRVQAILAVCSPFGLSMKFADTRPGFYNELNTWLETARHSSEPVAAQYLEGVQ